MNLQGKVTLITGAKGGLGSFVTEAFLAAGAKVIGVSRSIQATDFSHPEFTAMPAGLSTGEAARKVAADVAARFGRIDALVHVMGGFAGGTRVDETDDATFEQMLDVNYRAGFFIVRALLPQMRQQGGGRILAVASRQGVEPAAMVGAYSASKAALVSLIHTVALENKDRGISANTVLPGTMETPANRAGDPKADRAQWVQPSQVAALLVHLASDASTQVTGAAIPVYGPQV
ncbi:MAG TPA: SDR family NAD(P)-dependent oxidoreductase [Candidatus Acidoferrales bacterium]|nr:SDR family NAD(P)-dependent oxidoreductase [Candidatus Acidoferrales bacterium]